MAGTVDHDGSKSAVDTGLADIKIRAMIQMKADRDVRILDDRSFHKLHQVGMVRIFPRSCGYLKDERGL